MSERVSNEKLLKAWDSWRYATSFAMHDLSILLLQLLARENPFDFSLQMINRIISQVSTDHIILPSENPGDIQDLDTYQSLSN